MNKLNRPGIYEDALLNNIVTTEDNEFVVNMTYMKKILGPKFIKINIDAIGGSLRNILTKYNIDVRRKSHIDGMILTMNYITEGH